MMAELNRLEAKGKKVVGLEPNVNKRTIIYKFNDGTHQEAAFDFDHQRFTESYKHVARYLQTRSEKPMS